MKTYKAITPYTGKAPLSPSEMSMTILDLQKRVENLNKRLEVLEFLTIPFKDIEKD